MLEITQGDTERLTIGLVNLDDLPNDHPIKVAGFQAEGYLLRFVAKRDLNEPDSSGLNLGNDSFLRLNATEAVITVLPADTLGLTVPGPGVLLTYNVQFAKADGSDVFTTERGDLFIRRHAAITAP